MINPGPKALFASLLLPTAALAQINVGDELGVSETAILAALDAQGYVASEIEREDGVIEVEVTQAGEPYEILVSPETGMVLAVSLDDDGDNDDDDDDGDDDDEDDDGTDND